VPAITRHDSAYLLQTGDGRVVFVLPYEEQFSLIGTTETLHAGDPGGATVDEAEIDYLLSSVNRQFQPQRSRAEIRHQFAGVRPLLDDNAGSLGAVSRDYRLELNHDAGQAPLLSVFGGKITSFRRLAQKAVDRLRPYFPPLPDSVTRRLILPGGDFTSQAELRDELQRRHPWLDPALCRRWVRTYGSHSHALLDNASCMADLGPCFGADLTRREVDYLCQREWALTADDILWRRTKRGLFLDANQREALDRYLGRPYHERLLDQDNQQ